MYNDNPLSAVCFWLLCILSAVSFLVTVTFTMWSSVVLAVAGVNSVAPNQRSIRDRRD
jgi:hypothetical protein